MSCDTFLAHRAQTKVSAVCRYFVPAKTKEREENHHTHGHTALFPPNERCDIIPGPQCMHDEFQNRLFGTHAAARPRHDRQPPSRQPPLLRRRLCRHRTRAQRLRRRTSRSAMISLLLFTTASFHHRFCSPPLLFTTASVHHRFFFHHRRYFSPAPHRFFSPPLLSVHHRFFSPPLPSTTASFHDRFFSRPLPFTTASFHDRFFSPPRLFRPAALFPCISQRSVRVSVSRFCTPVRLCYP